MRRSTRGMTAERIDERLDGLGATLSVEASRSTASFHGGAIARSMEGYLDLCRGIVTEPEFDQAEFERIVEETRAQWVESLDNDSALVRRYFTRQFFENHPYARLPSGTPTSLDRIRLEDLKELHGKLFDRESLLIALSGDIEASACARLQQGVESAFGHRPSDVSSETIGAAPGP
jgi:predicted Zn-dependent peptidase